MIGASQVSISCHLLKRLQALQLFLAMLGGQRELERIRQVHVAPLKDLADAEQERRDLDKAHWLATQWR